MDQNSLAVRYESSKYGMGVESEMPELEFWLSCLAD